MIVLYVGNFVYILNFCLLHLAHVPNSLDRGLHYVLIQFPILK
jgi:hypothetical protein